MPSGHCQTISYLTYILLRKSAPGWMGMCYALVGWAAVVVSRTKHGGPYLCVSIDGKVPGCHTVPQVIAGSLVGFALGHLTYGYIY
jgi:hypothetical protein